MHLCDMPALRNAKGHYTGRPQHGAAHQGSKWIYA
nr:MAG TPA: hypothetical protein [Caudoviricetes sp.]